MVKYKNKLQFTLKLNQSIQPVSNFSFTNLERTDYKLQLRQGYNSWTITQTANKI